jgi:signal transduction histidine kinase/ActR/RegA family two-component response regulator/sensor domain CHASE-containing protein
MVIPKKNHYISLILLAIFGAALAFATFVTIKDFEDEKIALNLREKSEDRIFTFQQLIDTSIEELISLAAFFNASEKVERLEFREFSQSILKHHQGFLALEWIPRVPDSERRRHEASARQEGLSNYRISQREKQGVMVAAKKREEYFPVYYLEPQAGNELALGYDLGSNPTRFEALLSARDRGEPGATSRVTLVQEQEEHFAFLIYMPIYKKGVPSHSVASRREALLGFVLGVFRIDDLLKDALSVLSPQGINMYLFDKEEKNPDKRFLGFYASSKKSGPFTPEMDEKMITQGYYYSRNVSVADRTWKIYCVPSQEFIFQYKSWHVWGVPGVILLFVVFVICYVMFYFEHAERIKQHAIDLLRAKEELEAEIIERKRSEKEKANLEIQLRHAHRLESIGTLAGGIAHDFNNILTIIIGNTDLARLSVPDGSPVHTKLEKVISASNRAKNLVSQILSFSREGGQDLQAVRPHLIVRETVDMLRSTIPAMILIKEDIDPECGTIFVDPTQIDQILINLCTNAVHAMNEKGILGIGLKQKILGEKEIFHRPDMVPGIYVELSVSDTGAGIDPAIIERVFDPFFTTKGVGEGTGMGLSMVHGIVMSHHGMITVDSEPGKGSTFHICFPVMESEDVEPEENQLSLPAGTERILLVDDEEGITELGKSILEQQGYEVITRASGNEALSFFKSGADEIDLVITDQSMPEMSGTELTAELKKIRADIPVILCSGFSKKVSSEEEAKTFGITQLLMKPLDRQALVETVRKILDEKQDS